MTNINCLKLLKSIQQFLIDYKENILDEHLEEILECNSRLNQYKCTPKNGEHYNTCIWLSENCQDVPDTCACYMLEKRVMRLKKIMSLYERMNKKHCCN